MRSPSRRTALWGLLGLGPGWAWAQQADSPAAREAAAPALPSPGTTLTLPALQLLDGQAWQASARTPLVVYWWASTCPFCAEQSPAMDKLWRAHGPGGLPMITLSVDRRPEDARAYLQRRGYRWPCAWVSPEVHRLFPKPRGLPITLVLDRNGRVLQAEKGQLFAEDVALLARWAQT
jgi:Redoxin